MPSRSQPICATYPAPWKSTNAVKASNFGSVAARVTSQTPDPANPGQMITVTIAKVFGGLQDKPEDAKELAAFIVEAVNSHAALKARVAELEKQLNTWKLTARSLDEEVDAQAERITELEGALRALRLQALQSSVNDPANEWGLEALHQANAALSHAGPVARDGEK
jgi:hypothetical protein